jgi:GNAT superfamily N-acetyltransferase
MATAGDLTNNIARERAGGLAGTGAVAEFDTAHHWQETLRDGTRVLIRPMRKEDASLEREFLERLSPQSRAYRFLGQVKVSDELVRQLTNVDSGRDLAFVAVRHDAGEKKEVGVSRFCLSDDGASCECAVAVSDEWQGRGLGHLLMRHLIEVARQRGIKRMFSVDMATNRPMRDLATSLGFEHKINADYPSEVIYSLIL